MTHVEENMTLHTEPAPEPEPELRVWTAVIVRALRDLELTGNHADAVKRWALTRGQDDDFIRVCDLAGMDPAYVRKRMVQIIDDKNDYKNAPPIDEFLLSGRRFTVSILGIPAHMVMQRIDELQKSGHKFARIDDGVYQFAGKKRAGGIKRKRRPYRSRKEERTEIDAMILTGEIFHAGPNKSFTRHRITALREKGWTIRSLGNSLFRCENVSSATKSSHNSSS